LDYHRTYDVATVNELFDAYGARGRAMYAWDLIVDTFYPLAVAGAAMLFALIVVRKPIFQKIVIALPLIFLVTDLIENAFLLLFIASYPSLSPVLVYISSFFTGIKLFTIYPTWVEMVLFAPVAVLFVSAGLVKKRFFPNRKKPSQAV
jgi:membrane protein implicated in regulation of membrane protease activity